MYKEKEDFEEIL